MTQNLLYCRRCNRMTPWSAIVTPSGWKPGHCWRCNYNRVDEYQVREVFRPANRASGEYRVTVPGPVVESRARIWRAG